MRDRLALSLCAHDADPALWGTVPTGYLAELYMPQLTQQHVTNVVKEVMDAFVAYCEAGSPIPQKDALLSQARNYSALFDHAVTYYNKRLLQQEFYDRLVRAGIPVSRLYIVDLLSLGSVVIDWLLYPRGSYSRTAVAYRGVLQDWLGLCALVHRWDDPRIDTTLGVDSERLRRNLITDPTL